MWREVATYYGMISRMTSPGRILQAIDRTGATTSTVVASFDRRVPR
jgi:hypothetical protein